MSRMSILLAAGGPAGYAAARAKAHRAAGRLLSGQTRFDLFNTSCHAAMSSTMATKASPAFMPLPPLRWPPFVAARLLP